ncbi:MAG: bifunctional adenosylcobinamide kinase/adenosylcobinamide-phosphate guanylyltransferase [Candidatus Coatesbacteria bacterium]
MGRLTYLTGGVRSGKSRRAVELARRRGVRVLFIATCVPGDDEMRRRVAAHRSTRPAEWETVEEDRDVAGAIRAAAGRCDVAIVDCLTMFVSSRILAGEPDETIEGRVRDFVAAAAGPGPDVIVVSNEVGSGVVPASELGRRFRDLAGAANQIVAGAAGEATLMVSGYPVELKREVQP